MAPSVQAGTVGITLYRQALDRSTPAHFRPPESENRHLQGNAETLAFKYAAGQPTRTAAVQLITHWAFQHRHVELDGVANARLDIGEVAMAFRKT